MVFSKPTKTVAPPSRRLRSQATRTVDVEEESSSSGEETDVEESRSPSPPSSPPPLLFPNRRNKKNGTKGGTKKSNISQQPGLGGQSQPTAGGNPLEQSELVTNAIQHILLAQQKKFPIKKSDLLKCMNGQTKDFKMTLTEVAETLDETFGFQLVGIKQVKDNSWEECGLDFAGNFMIASKFVRAILPILEGSDSGMSEKDVAKEDAVRFILNSLYIANRDVDEDYIWRILVSTKLDTVCSQRDDLRKFLKAELVDPMYVARTEIKSHDEIGYRYSWGVRSELECDKLEMLKHISHIFQKPMASFKKQYDALLNDKKYKERMVAMSRSEQNHDKENNVSRRRHNSVNSVGEEDLQEIIVEDDDEEIVEEEEAVNRRRTRNRSSRK